MEHQQLPTGLSNHLKQVKFSLSPSSSGLVSTVSLAAKVVQQLVSNFFSVCRLSVKEKQFLLKKPQATR